MRDEYMFPDARRPHLFSADAERRMPGSKKLDAKRVKIAISGKSGCGNSTLCSVLAERCRVNKTNYTFRNLAADYGLSLQEITKRAEQDHTIDWYIDSKLHALFEDSGGILGSRLAVWLEASTAFTVYLDASLTVRAQRISQREQRPYGEVYEETRRRDATDEHRYHKFYAVDINDYGFVDTVCNGEQRSPEMIADLILDEYQKRIG